MTRAVFAAALALCLFQPADAGAVEALLPRHPAPSPDGSQIAFSWQGDLWLVDSRGGIARRLTAHPAADRYPVWSRDGRWIAFESNRHGNDDVYVMAADASQPPRRLTFASADDRPVDFMPDGGGVLFASRREETFRLQTSFYIVPLEGGTPRLLMPALGLFAAWSPDGGTLALVRGSTRWTRRGYRGAANRDLFLWRGGEDFEQLTDFDGDDDRPAWIDESSLLFLSSREGRKNLFLRDMTSGEVRALTRHQGSDVRFPRASADGRLVAYEFEDGLWTLSPVGGEPRRLSIEVAADPQRNAVEHRLDREGASSLAVHPEAAVAAFVVHGDVFLTAVLSADEQEIAPPATVRLSDTPGVEEGLSWSPDGDSLLVTSHRTGGGDLYRVQRQDPARPWTENLEFSWQRLTRGETSERSGRYSPDGKRIAFLRGLGDLVVIDADGSGERTLLEHWGEPDFHWSPDSRWLAYSVPDMAFNNEVFLQAVGGGEPYNVSRHPDDDLAPRFTPDGRRLVWLSKRHADTFDLWSVWLSREDHERLPQSWLTVLKEPAAEPPAAGQGQGQGEPEPPPASGPKTGPGGGEEEDAESREEKEPVTVHIDFAGLWERAQALTDLRGDEGSPVPGPKGRRILFTSAHQGEGDLYSIRWDGKDLERLTRDEKRPADVQVVGDTVYFLTQKGQVQRLGLDGKAGDPMPFAARYEVDRREEEAVVFDAAWQALADLFYDPGFHGVDWPAQREKYRPWALAASHPSDFDDVVNLMLGELDASHMGYFPPREGGGETTGWIGALFDPQAGGPGLLVKEVLEDSPADRLDVRLQAGERLLAVDGEAVEAATNVYGLFAESVGERVRLRILQADGEERAALVVPVELDEIIQLRYRQWTRERQALVEQASGGRLGYLHIQGMNIPSFEEFEHALYTAGEGKDGLVIDVRANSGGWTTDYLMAVLSVRRHARTVPRGGDPAVRAYPQGRLPLSAWTRPAVTVCDQNSYSNAEIFAHAFKTLERGKVVGTPTFGAVISTGGTRLINGGFVRQPFRGWYVAGSDLNMERNGAVPDVIVSLPPEQDTSATEDAQLQEAVEVLLQELERDPRAGSW